MENYFATLNGINVNDKVEKKNGLSYLSWAWAWAEVKKRFPDAVYTIYENKDGWCYHTDGKTCWVKTGVTVNGIEHIEYLPVMNYNNRSIPADQVTSFDVNKAIQRSLTKAVARHGLGLYIYAGEDLPEGEEPEPIKDKVEDIAHTDDGRRQVVSALIAAHGIDNPTFNGLYGAYCAKRWGKKPTLTSLTDEEFDDVIMAINNELNKGQGVA